MNFSMLDSTLIDSEVYCLHLSYDSKSTQIIIIFFRMLQFDWIFCRFSVYISCYYISTEANANACVYVIFIYIHWNKHILTAQHSKARHAYKFKLEIWRTILITYTHARPNIHAAFQYILLAYSHLHHRFVIIVGVFTKRMNTLLLFSKKIQLSPSSMFQLSYCCQVQNVPIMLAMLFWFKLNPMKILNDLIYMERKKMNGKINWNAVLFTFKH